MNVLNPKFTHYEIGFFKEPPLYVTSNDIKQARMHANLLAKKHHNKTIVINHVQQFEVVDLYYPNCSECQGTGKIDNSFCLTCEASGHRS